MLYANNKTDEPIRPSKSGQRAKCPNCNGVMIAHVGTRVIAYWAHESLEECDPWAEKFSTAEGHQWHLSWQDPVEPPGRVEKSITRNGVRHQADIEAADGTVTEVQHSPIKADDIIEREQFYGRMIWIWDATKAYRNEYLTTTGNNNLIENDWRTFKWLRARISVLDCQRPIFLDLGNDWLMRVAELTNGSPVQGEGILVTKEQMIKWITHGPPGEDAATLLAKKREAERAAAELIAARKRAAHQARIEAERIAEQKRAKERAEWQERERWHRDEARRQAKVRDEVRVRRSAEEQEVVRRFQDRLMELRGERERRAKMCNYWLDGHQCESTENTRPYLPGPRCSQHTPAALAGRPESA